MAEVTLVPEMQVSAIAAKWPATLRMMEALGIDFCCGGKRPLGEAAAAAGVPVETAIAVLQTAIAQAASAPAEEPDWTQEPLDALMDHIVETHHTYMHREMPRLGGMLELIARVHGPNHGDVLQPLLETYGALRSELDAHLAKEEVVTFPAVARLLARQEGNGAAGSIAELVDEHDTAGDALATMRRVTRNYEVPGDVCATYQAVYDGLQEMERDIHRHIHLENNILFPRALKLAAR